MTDGLSKIVGVFVAVLLLFIYPICHMADQQEETSKILVLVATTHFVDSIRDKGYIDIDMYDQYLEDIALTGPAYQVEMEHMHKIYYPVYTDITDPDTFTGEIEVVYEGFFTNEIQQTLDTVGVYYFSKDDYIEVETTNTTRTFAAKVRSFIFGGNMDTSTIYVKYGGQIRYEN